MRAFFTLGCFSFSAAAPPNTKQKEKAGERGEGRKGSAVEHFAFFFLVGGRAADKRHSERPSWTFMAGLLRSWGEGEGEGEKKEIERERERETDRERERDRKEIEREGERERKRERESA